MDGFLYDNGLRHERVNQLEFQRRIDEFDKYWSIFRISVRFAA